MFVQLAPFTTSDAPQNEAQDRVLYRLQGRLSSELAKLLDSLIEKDDAEMMRMFQVYVGNDPDAWAELATNGSIKKLLRGVQNGSDVAAECLIAFNSLSKQSEMGILDEKTRPRPYWIRFYSSDKHSLLGILIRYSMPLQKGKGQRPNYEVGLTLWGASLVFCKTLLEGNPKLFQSDSVLRVLELGSGLGLSGLALAKLKPNIFVDLTDFNADVVRNCAFNIELNGMTDTCRSFELDWKSLPEQVEDDCKYDVIFGTDIVCQPEDGLDIAHVLKKYLKHGGRAIFILGSEESRYGVKEFESIMISQQFTFSSKVTLPGNVEDWVQIEHGKYDELVGVAKSFIVYELFPMGS